jgi:hypothetical protein
MLVKSIRQDLFRKKKLNQNLQRPPQNVVQGLQSEMRWAIGNINVGVPKEKFAM